MGRDNDAEQKAICDAQWRAFCNFAKKPMGHCDDPRERWDVVPVARPKPKPKHTRIHKLTIAKAMRQAAKAGVTPVAVTIKPDGAVSLIFPKNDGDSPSTRSEGENEWDSVLQ